MQTMPKFPPGLTWRFNVLLAAILVGVLCWAGGYALGLSKGEAACTYIGTAATTTIGNK